MPRMTAVTRLCERCGAEYTPNYASKGRGEQRFCSPACATADRFGDPVELHCQQCDALLPFGNRKRVYCSAECRNKAKVGRPSPKRKGWDDYPPPVCDPETGCLRWQGTHHSRGYGLVGSKYAHREAWIRENGPIPEGLTIDHVRKRGCIYRDCVNTAHMEVVPQPENTRRSTRSIEQRERTHCPKNHPYAGDNLIIRRGKRECRTCVRERNAAAYWRRKEAQQAST